VPRYSGTASPTAPRSSTRTRCSRSTARRRERCARNVAFLRWRWTADRYDLQNGTLTVTHRYWTSWFLSANPHYRHRSSKLCRRRLHRGRARGRRRAARRARRRRRRRARGDGAAGRRAGRAGALGYLGLRCDRRALRLAAEAISSRTGAHELPGKGPRPPRGFPPLRRSASAAST
jgi:hypothetical protein